MLNLCSDHLMINMKACALFFLFSLVVAATADTIGGKQHLPSC